MSIRCFLHPRGTATPGELMDLAAAVERWRLQERAACGVAPEVSGEAMSDLRNGLPPMVVDGALAERPTVLVTLSPDFYSPEMALQTLRQSVPAALVDEILLA